MVVFRHLLAVAALPFVVAVAIPFWLLGGGAAHLAIGGTRIAAAVQAGGIIVLAIGVALFAASLQRFAADGKGTLAPWDPPRRLVVRGPYRYVRNPMISGVIFVLFGEALLLRSESHLAWAIAILAVNAVYIPLLEEPQLSERFGAEYEEYCRHVPRLMPRQRPWTPAGSGDSA